MDLGGQVLRVAVISALSLATAAMFLVSMRGNYLFGYELGQTPEKQQLFAWANVAADVWKAVGLLALASLWRRRHRRIAIVGGIAWAACLTSGINSAISVYVKDRMTITSAREAGHASYAEAQNELADLEWKMSGVAVRRGVGQIEAAIAAVLNAPIVIDERVRGTVGQRSANCTRVETRTAEACAKISAFGEELAAAKERESLEARVTALRVRVQYLRERGAADAPDPVGEFYAWATRGLLSVRDVAFGFPLFFAFLIETVSTFGPVTIARYAELTRTTATQPDVQVRPDAARRSELYPAPTRLDRMGDAVIQWMALRVVPATTASAIGLETLHDDYVRWCAGVGVHPNDAAAFASAFDAVRDMPELAGKIRRFGTRYYGIRLADDVLISHGQ